MISAIHLNLNALGKQTGNVPVKVDIYDASLKRIDSRWLKASETLSLPVPPGIYGVRATLASGALFEQTIQVKSGEQGTCTLELYQASPHEDHEWAYLTQPINPVGERLLSEKQYKSVWLRMWRRSRDGSWEIVPIPVNDVQQATWNEDGVTYSFHTSSSRLHLLQVGGPEIPWKNVALPSSQEVMVLVRPAAGPVEAVHPLDVVVSSDDWRTESLLSLMQRGDLSTAQSLYDELQLAEELLRQKMVNTNAAAVGGYFLLRARDLERLHNWANNLANWFEWMADGPVIHAWQIIMESKDKSKQRSGLLEQARMRLLEAVSRGFPIYTEGLRLLRDGLLYFDSRAQGKDTEIATALTRIGAYAGAADWSATNTTFTGKSPGTPEAGARKGTPKDKAHLIYVFDVPLAEILSKAKIKPNEALIAEVSGKKLHTILKESGELQLEDGRTFKDLGALQKHATGDTRNAWWTWRTAGDDESLDSIATSLRISPMT